MAAEKAHRDDTVKRRRKRNKRTAVSPSLSESSSAVSESESERRAKRRAKKSKASSEIDMDGATPPKLIKKEKKKGPKKPPVDPLPAESLEESSHEVEMEDEHAKPIQEVGESDFSSWYLRQVTKELEDDLDKIRGSGDFNETSLPILIHALQQGEAIFSPEERRRIIGAAL